MVPPAVPRTFNDLGDGRVSIHTLTWKIQLYGKWHRLSKHALHRRHHVYGQVKDSVDIFWTEEMTDIGQTLLKQK